MDYHDQLRIKSIDGSKVVLTENLKYFHFGADKPLKAKYGTIDMRAAVLYLSRNVKI